MLFRLDVQDLDVFGLFARTGPDTDCLMRMRNVREALIHGCRLRGQVRSIIDANDTCENIYLRANAFPEN